MSVENVKDLLQTFTSVTIDSTYDTIIQYLYNNEQQHILNDCNLTELPKELEYIVEERTAGRFIQTHKNVLLSSDELNVVTKIKEGDTEVNFGTNTSAESRLDAIVTSWLSNRERDMACYRKLKW